MDEAIFVGTLIPLFFLLIMLKGENKLLILFFIWGLIAFAISLNLNNNLVRYFQMDTFQLSVSWAPLIEELTKALPLGYFLFRSEKTKIPVACFGIAIGIGFSIQENYMYLLRNMAEDCSPVYFVFTRSVTSCLLHATTTGIMGFGINLIKKLRGLIWPFLFGLYTLAVTIHALYNLYICSCYSCIGMLMPLVLYLIGFIIINISEDKGGRKRFKF